MTTICTSPARLDREWKALRGRSAVLRRAAAWGLPVHLDTLDDLLLAVGLVPGRPGAAGPAAEVDHSPGGGADRLLAHLVLAAREDTLAARVVLQRLVPGLCTRARRWARFGAQGWEGAFDELVAAAWVVIRTYPVERRPTHLAGGLLRAVEQQAFLRGTRRCWQADAVPPHTMDELAGAEPATEPLLEVVDALRAADGVLSARDREVLVGLASGWSQEALAASMEVSVRTVRNYRDAAVHRVRAALVA